MAVIEDFNKLEIRTGVIREVRAFPEARKPAYRLFIDFGEEIGLLRSSAQLVDRYSPEELEGMTVLAVVNFPPRQIGPFTSEVLVLGVPDEDGRTVLVVPEAPVPKGASRESTMKGIGIIPARYTSTRFPGKPLAEVNGKPMIRRVYEQAKKSGLLSGVYVATDDARILDAVLGFGGDAFMTSPDHPSGTDRCNEVVQLLAGQGIRADAVVNVQGDEPYIHPEQIDLVASCFEDPGVEIATLVRKIASSDELFSPSVIKVTVDARGDALYFSRSPIPFIQQADHPHWIDRALHFKHIGIYGYRVEVLRSIAGLPPSSLEQAESLEQLRWLENGYRIRVRETSFESHAVDRPEDLSKFTNRS